jgi:hypothetical protein
MIVTPDAAVNVNPDAATSLASAIRYKYAEEIKDTVTCLSVQPDGVFNVGGVVPVAIKTATIKSPTCSPVGFVRVTEPDTDVPSGLTAGTVRVAIL